MSRAKFVVNLFGRNRILALGIVYEQSIMPPRKKFSSLSGISSRGLGSMHPLRSILCSSASALCLFTMAAKAGELADHAAKAERLIQEGQTVQALAAIEAAFNSVWDKAPLGFSEALFVNEKPQGFGIYTMRPKPVFRPGEDMLVYAEPFGYGYGQKDNGFEIAFEADFELSTPKGQILHAQEAFAKLSTQTNRRNKEFQIFITYNFQGLKPGDYVLMTRLRDKYSNKSGSFELPFTLVDLSAQDKN